MIQKGDLAFGDIVWTDFDPSIGHEFQNKRPALVIESDIQLRKSSIVTVVPLTGNTLNNVPFDDILVLADTENNLRSDSVAKMHYITSFDYARFDKKIGKVGATILYQIKSYLKRHFDL